VLLILFCEGLGIGRLLSSGVHVFKCQRFGKLCLFHLHRRVSTRLCRWNRQSVIHFEISRVYCSKESDRQIQKKNDAKNSILSGLVTYKLDYTLPTAMTHYCFTRNKTSFLIVACLLLDYSPASVV
jgi:hypothetical protein